MNVRVARGSQLPKGWHPGKPLTVGRQVAALGAPLHACPFGPECYACRNGLQWNPVLGTHRIDRTQPGRAVERRRRAARRQSR